MTAKDGEIASPLPLTTKLKEVFSNKNCDACNRILEAFDIEYFGDIHLRTELGTIEELLCADCPQHHAFLEAVWKLWEKQARLWIAPKNHHEYTLQLSRNSYSSSVNLEVWWKGAQHGRGHPLPPFDIIMNRTGGKIPGPFEIVKHRTGGMIPGQGLLLDRSWISINQMHGWYYTCKSEHGNACSTPPYLAEMPKPVLRYLVDTKERRLVPVEEPPFSYVALSYLYGEAAIFIQTRADLDRLCEHGALDDPQISSLTPRTISHAMRAVIAVGERYLWVASLCVDHEERVMREQLQSKAGIYAHASLVICVAGGADANSGIPGLSCVADPVPRHLDQETYPFGDDLILKRIAPEKKSSKHTAEYWKQEGTVEEHRLSRRCLVFEDDTVRFECCTSSKFEDLY